MRAQLVADDRQKATLKDELIGKLEIVPVRKVFSNETQFTKWLEVNIERLSERLGLELTVVQREKTVGDFNVDLLCEDGEGKQVIIENQLEKTNHDHLGKVLTYLVNLEATTAIWITPEPRLEHQKVVDWLNESTPADISFYLVKVEAIRIDNSAFAPHFTPFATPNKQEKEVGKKKKEWADRHIKRLEFWKSLIERSRNKTRLFSNITPGRYHYIQTGAGISGVTFVYVVNKDGGSVELYIDHDHDENGKGNKDIFDALHVKKNVIENNFGEKLEWDRLDHRRASRIRRRFTLGGLAATETWPELQDHMIDAMIQLEKALRPHLEQL